MGDNVGGAKAQRWVFAPPAFVLGGLTGESRMKQTAVRVGGGSVGNQVEEAAIEFVIAIEAAEGRSARDARREPGVPTDVVSLDRLIEVKAYGGSARGHDLWLEPAQVTAALAAPIGSGCTWWTTCLKAIRSSSDCSASVVPSGRTCSQAARSDGISRSRFPSGPTTQRSGMGRHRLRDVRVGTGAHGDATLITHRRRRRRPRWGR